MLQNFRCIILVYNIISFSEKYDNVSLVFVAFFSNEFVPRRASCWKNTSSELISVICRCCVSHASISLVSRHLACSMLRFPHYNSLFLCKPFTGCRRITFINFVGAQNAGTRNFSSETWGPRNPMLSIVRR